MTQKAEIEVTKSKNIVIRKNDSEDKNGKTQKTKNIGKYCYLEKWLRRQKNISA